MTAVNKLVVNRKSSVFTQHAVFFEFFAQSQHKFLCGTIRALSAAGYARPVTPLDAIQSLTSRALNPPLDRAKSDSVFAGNRPHTFAQTNTLNDLAPFLLARSFLAIAAPLTFLDILSDREVLTHG